MFFNSFIISTQSPITYLLILYQVHINVLLVFSQQKSFVLYTPFLSTLTCPFFLSKYLRVYFVFLQSLKITYQLPISIFSLLLLLIFTIFLSVSIFIHFICQIFLSKLCKNNYYKFIFMFENIFLILLKLFHDFIQNFLFILFNFKLFLDTTQELRFKIMMLLNFFRHVYFGFKISACLISVSY